MKWVSLIVVLIVGGGLYYGLFMRPAPEGTLTITAERYVDAALANDMAAVEALCVEEGASSAKRVARVIHSVKPDANSFKWAEVATDEPDRKAVSGIFQGMPLQLDMTNVDGDWKIVSVTN